MTYMKTAFFTSKHKLQTANLMVGTWSRDFLTFAVCRKCWKTSILISLKFPGNTWCQFNLFSWVHCLIAVKEYPELIWIKNKILEPIWKANKGQQLYRTSPRSKQHALLNSCVALLTMKFLEESPFSSAKNFLEFHIQTNCTARSWCMSCTLTDLPFTCISPIIPLKRLKLKHQKAWTGPQSITHSFKWQWRCMFGVTYFLPYSRWDDSPH